MDRGNSGCAGMESDGASRLKITAGGNSGCAEMESDGARLPFGRVIERPPPRIHPMFSQHVCQRVENGRGLPAMTKCDHQGPSQNRIVLIETTTGGGCLLPMQARYC